MKSYRSYKISFPNGLQALAVQSEETPDISALVDTLMTELAPTMDSHLMVLTLAGLLFHHLEARKISEVMEGGRPEHQEIPTLANHITGLLLHGVRAA